MGTACRKRSPPWLLPPRRSRSSLLPRGSTPSGSAAPSWLPSPPSRRCGSPSRNSTRLDPELSTENAFRLRLFSLRRTPNGFVMFYEYRFVFLLFFSTFIRIFHHEITKSLTLDDFSRFPLK